MGGSLIEDLLLAAPRSTWTSQEHQRQDNLGDLAALSDLQGQINWSAEMQSDIDALLAQVTPDNVDTFCAQQTLGRSQIQNGSLNWQGPYPAFLQQATNAFNMRKSEANLSFTSSADFQNYGKPISRTRSWGPSSSSVHLRSVPVGRRAPDTARAATVPARARPAIPERIAR